MCKDCNKIDIPIGPQGPTGATGATGPAGPKGDKGDTGDCSCVFTTNFKVYDTDGADNPITIANNNVASETYFTSVAAGTYLVWYEADITMLKASGTSITLTYGINGATIVRHQTDTLARLDGKIVLHDKVILASSGNIGMAYSVDNGGTGSAAINNRSMTIFKVA